MVDFKLPKTLQDHANQSPLFKGLAADTKTIKLTVESDDMAGVALTDEQGWQFLKNFQLVKNGNGPTGLPSVTGEAKKGYVLSLPGDVFGDGLTEIVLTEQAMAAFQVVGGQIIPPSGLSEQEINFLRTLIGATKQKKPEAAVKHIKDHFSTPIVYWDYDGDLTNGSGQYTNDFYAMTEATYNRFADSYKAWTDHATFKEMAKPLAEQLGVGVVSSDVLDRNDVYLPFVSNDGKIKWEKLDLSKLEAILARPDFPTTVVQLSKIKAEYVAQRARTDGEFFGVSVRAVNFNVLGKGRDGRDLPFQMPVALIPKALQTCEPGQNEQAGFFKLKISLPAEVATQLVKMSELYPSEQNPICSVKQEGQQAPNGLVQLAIHIDVKALGQMQTALDLALKGIKTSDDPAVKDKLEVAGALINTILGDADNDFNKNVSKEDRKKIREALPGILQQLLKNITTYQDKKTAAANIKVGDLSDNKYFEVLITLINDSDMLISEKLQLIATLKQLDEARRAVVQGDDNLFWTKALGIPGAIMGVMMLVAFSKRRQMRIAIDSAVAGAKASQKELEKERDVDVSSFTDDLTARVMKKYKLTLENLDYIPDGIDDPNSTPELRQALRIFRYTKGDAPKSLFIHADAGAGKSRFLEQLAYHMARLDLKEFGYIKYRIITVNPSAMKAGTVYHGQIEGRIKALVDLVSFEKNEKKAKLLEKILRSLLKIRTSDPNSSLVTRKLIVLWKKMTQIDIQKYLDKLYEAESDPLKKAAIKRVQQIFKELQEVIPHINQMMQADSFKNATGGRKFENILEYWKALDEERERADKADATKAPTAPKEARPLEAAWLSLLKELRDGDHDAAAKEWANEQLESISRSIRRMTKEGEKLIPAVDEVHQLGGNIMDAFKIALAEDDARMIALTTNREAPDFIRGDAAIARRFYFITLRTLTQPEVEKVMYGFRDEFAQDPDRPDPPDAVVPRKYPKMKISNQVMDALVRLAYDMYEQAQAIAPEELKNPSGEQLQSYSIAAHTPISLLKRLLPDICAEAAMRGRSEATLTLDDVIVVVKEKYRVMLADSFGTTAVEQARKPWLLGPNKTTSGKFPIALRNQILTEQAIVAETVLATMTLTADGRLEARDTDGRIKGLDEIIYDRTDARGEAKAEADLLQGTEQKSGGPFGPSESAVKENRPFVKQKLQEIEELDAHIRNIMNGGDPKKREAKGTGRDAANHADCRSPELILAREAGEVGNNADYILRLEAVLNAGARTPVISRATGETELDYIVRLQRDITSRQEANDYALKDGEQIEDYITRLEAYIKAREAVVKDFEISKPDEKPAAGEAPEEKARSVRDLIFETILDELRIEMISNGATDLKSGIEDAVRLVVKHMDLATGKFSEEHLRAYPWLRSFNERFKVTLVGGIDLEKKHNITLAKSKLQKQAKAAKEKLELVTRLREAWVKYGVSLGQLEHAKNPSYSFDEDAVRAEYAGDALSAAGYNVQNLEEETVKNLEDWVEDLEKAVRGVAEIREAIVEIEKARAQQKILLEGSEVRKADGSIEYRTSLELSDLEEAQARKLGREANLNNPPHDFPNDADADDYLKRLVDKVKTTKAALEEEKKIEGDKAKKMKALRDKALEYRNDQARIAKEAKGGTQPESKANEDELNKKPLHEILAEMGVVGNLDTVLDCVEVTEAETKVTGAVAEAVEAQKETLEFYEQKRSLVRELLRVQAQVVVDQVQYTRGGNLEVDERNLDRLAAEIALDGEIVHPALRALFPNSYQEFVIPERGQESEAVHLEALKHRLGDQEKASADRLEELVATVFSEGEEHALKEEILRLIHPQTGLLRANVTLSRDVKTLSENSTVDAIDLENISPELLDLARKNLSRKITYEKGHVTSVLVTFAMENGEAVTLPGRVLSVLEQFNISLTTQGPPKTLETINTELLAAIKRDPLYKSLIEAVDGAHSSAGMATSEQSNAAQAEFILSVVDLLHSSAENPTEELRRLATRSTLKGSYLVTPAGVSTTATNPGGWDAKLTALGIDLSLKQDLHKLLFQLRANTMAGHEVFKAQIEQAETALGAFLQHNPQLLAYTDRLLIDTLKMYCEGPQAGPGGPGPVALVYLGRAADKVKREIKDERREAIAVREVAREAREEIRKEADPIRRMVTKKGK
ncbi:MAG TPA: hypothetical protein DDW49_04750 [Deltaproteobacteria bacterium]|nr:MAG: hypothetical protein A2048_08880 [Deltaproteobacteria bacterium GWA2_45_12]HBF12687.1 hypothetical protein [Deltaproteobacteria bacterium]